MTIRLKVATSQTSDWLWSAVLDNAIIEDGVWLMANKIRILLVAANPFDTPLVRIDQEVRVLEPRLSAAGLEDSIDLVSVGVVRAEDLQEQLLRHRPEILHFSGHGVAQTEIVLEDSIGNAAPIPPAALRRLLGLFKEDVRIVVLDRIDSQSQAEAIAEVVDFTVAISSNLQDEAAIAFCGAFYRALAYKRSVRTAFDLGVNYLSLQGLGEYVTPELLVRSTVDASHAFVGTASNKDSSGSRLPPLPPDRSMMIQPPEPWPHKTRNT